MSDPTAPAAADVPQWAIDLVETLPIDTRYFTPTQNRLRLAGIARRIAEAAAKHAPVAAAGDVMAARVMNLPLGPAYKDAPTAGHAVGYQWGHRDARHAAAELLTAALSAPQAARDALAVAVADAAAEREDAISSRDDVSAEIASDAFSAALTAYVAAKKE